MMSANDSRATRWRRLLTIGVVFAATLTSGASAQAQNAAPPAVEPRSTKPSEEAPKQAPEDTKGRAERLYRDGKSAMGARRYEQACLLFEESQRLDPASGTLINLADCYERTGRRGSAWRAFTEAAEAAEARKNHIRAEEARDRAARLAAVLPKVVVTLADPSFPGLELRWDQAPLAMSHVGKPLPVDPGEHVIEASAPGYESYRAQVTAPPSSATVTVTIPGLSAMVAKASRSPSTSTRPSGLGAQRTAALAVGGLGVAGLIAGSIWGLVSMSQHDQSYEYCPENGVACSNRDQAVDAMDAARTNGTLSTIGFVVGGLGLATGAVLWFTSRKVTTERSDPQGVSPVRVGIQAGRVMAQWQW